MCYNRESTGHQPANSHWIGQAMHYAPKMCKLFVTISADTCTQNQTHGETHTQKHTHTDTHTKTQKHTHTHVHADARNTHANVRGSDCAE